METSLYKDQLLDHYRHPRNHGVLEQAHAHSEVSNPLCGDSIRIEILVTGNILDNVAFQGKGCVISQAAGSLLTEKVLSQPLDDIMLLTKEDMLELVGCSLGPTRLRCALLALESLHTAISHYKVKKLA